MISKDFIFFFFSIYSKAECWLFLMICLNYNRQRNTPSLPFISADSIVFFFRNKLLFFVPFCCTISLLFEGWLADELNKWVCRAPCLLRGLISGSCRRRNGSPQVCWEGEAQQLFPIHHRMLRSAGSFPPRCHSRSIKKSLRVDPSA